MKARAQKLKHALRHPRKRVSISTIALILATFFNPLGFDALFKIVMDWTGSYWITDMLFYCASLLFFGLYFYLRKREKKDPS